MVSLRLWLMIAGLVLTGACTPPSPPRSPVPSMPTDVPPPTPTPDRGPWSFSYVPGIHRYEIHSRARIEALESGSVDSIASLTYLTYSVGLVNDEVRIDGAVDSFFVAVGDSIPRAAHEITFPVPFTARLDVRGRLLEFTSPDTSTCGSAAGTLLATARELLIAAPAELVIGTTWEDSTSSSACRGDIPITVAASRRHRVDGVLDTSGATVLRLLRRSTMRIEGIGTRRVQTTTVTGSGQGETRILIEPATGMLREALGELTATLTFDAASRRQTFRQYVQTEIRALSRPERDNRW